MTSFRSRRYALYRLVGRSRVYWAGGSSFESLMGQWEVFGDLWRSQSPVNSGWQLKDTFREGFIWRWRINDWVRETSRGVRV